MREKGLATGFVSANTISAIFATVLLALNLTACSAVNKSTIHAAGAAGEESAQAPAATAEARAGRQFSSDYQWTGRGYVSPNQPGPIVENDADAEFLQADAAAPRTAEAPLATGRSARFDPAVKARSTFDDLLKTAFNQVGTGYRSGGKAPDTGFDCSGFTSWVYERIGVNLPRSSGEQFACGLNVAKDSLKEGDLVFFRKKSRISHVGIYVKNGSFIHSTRPGGVVRVNNLSEPNWEKQFAGARRVVNQY